MNLKEKLKRKGIKQIYLSKKTGINTSKLSMFVNGWHQLQDWELEALSGASGIPEEDLIEHYKESEISEIVDG